MSRARSSLHRVSLRRGPGEEQRVPRSSFCLHRKRRSTPPLPPRRRGPKTGRADAPVTERTSEVLSASPFPI